MRIAWVIAWLLCAPMVVFAGTSAEWTIATPRAGATLRTAYIAVTGIGPAGGCAKLQIDGKPHSEICTRPSGAFERIVKLPAGSHEIELAGLTSHLSVQPPSIRSSVAPDWESLQSGDVLLSRSKNSQQVNLYGPNFTHAAMYLGPDADGAAMIAEAVVAEDAEGLDEVRSIRIEYSLAYRRAEYLAFFRPVTPLNEDQLQAAVAYLRSVLNHGIRYWSTAEDFSTLYGIWRLWDRERDQPRDATKFDGALQRLDEQNRSLDRFNCSTLVWRTYLNATGGRLDLASSGTIQVGGSQEAAFTPAFLARVTPHIIIPDALYRSGKLREVAH